MVIQYMHACRAHCIIEAIYRTYRCDSSFDLSILPKLATDGAARLDGEESWIHPLIGSLGPRHPVTTGPFMLFRLQLLLRIDHLLPTFVVIPDA